ncbi:MAG: alpha-ketoacid dehydrogenase subunit beta, partial [Chloroflexi bacterium]|nr:alpha-ketoacid dehydrogenase subunit beta [Chloroflexota bacterium]
LMFSAINLVAASSIITDVAMTRYKLGGNVDVPLVIMGAGGGYGASGSSHSQSVQAKMMNSPGLKIVLPSNAYDAKGLMKTAIRDNDPVVFLSSSRLIMDRGNIPDEEYTVPFKQASVKKEGRDVTVVATSYMVRMAMSVAEKLAAEGISVEVIDPRTLVPLDKETILKSVAKTGRLVAMDESPQSCGVASEISATVCEEAFDSLKAPIKRVATMDIPLPGSAVMENFVLPSEEKLTKAIKSIMG